MPTYRNQGHEENLDATADHSGEQARVVRRSEHIAMHELPTGLLDGLFQGRQILGFARVVSGDVSPECPHHYHSYNSYNYI